MNTSAFPTSGIEYAKNGESLAQAGMTLRDYFAAKAMQGLLSDGSAYSNTDVAVFSYAVADEMMKARAA